VHEQPTVKESLLPAESEDVLELDEVWSFVFIKTAKYWLWTAICRRTRQIVAFVIGDRSAETCRRLWQKIPKQYRDCHTFSDFLGCIRKSLSERNSPKRWQGNGRDLPHGMLELYTSPEASPICPQDIILF
jgi:insertion element IS1 protein InsB